MPHHGATNYLDVVVAQTAAQQAEQTALGLQTRTLQASVQLVRALGGGWSTGDLPTGKMVTAAKTSP
jgi:outer membrane protein TolC